ncbi:NmrA family NAD(P)-binding protein [Mangrovivirga cuniculi]|uniref:NmrA-like family protein n=1 Tax=Mangrovivirga cuniculi TaxID=2715131 RepID=A0A4D7JL56_9BACT|nr:NmrA family NAD(P)-binding protein [Mangrovivirga cuniculi]QCK15623.1 NmrA-like family protein [Mangrovivirga cuniculi]
MKKILITGATGNVGMEVIEFLTKSDDAISVIAGVRNIQKAQAKFDEFKNLSFRHFDFEDQDSFNKAFKEIDIIFLLRPPHLSDVKKFFEPLLEAARNNGIEKIVFLSVQGADKTSIIPHSKIESLIKSLGFKHIFIRPGYFMQNLTTTLLPEIKNKSQITLPSGKSKFNWVDVKNVGEVAAILITEFKNYQNEALDITGDESESFQTVAKLITKITGRPVKFKSINPISFYFKKRKEGLKNGLAMVMTLLHFAPRITGTPALSKNYSQLTGKSPVTLAQFIEREKEKFQ